MAGTAKRVVFSIDEDVLTRFNRMFRPKQRSQIVEKMMAEVLTGRAREVAQAAMLIATDPAFREYDEAGVWADGQSIDTLSRF